MLLTLSCNKLQISQNIVINFFVQFRLWPRLYWYRTHDLTLQVLISSFSPPQQSKHLYFTACLGVRASISILIPSGFSSRGTDTRTGYNCVFIFQYLQFFIRSIPTTEILGLIDRTTCRTYYSNVHLTA